MLKLYFKQDGVFAPIFLLVMFTTFSGVASWIAYTYPQSAPGEYTIAAFTGILALCCAWTAIADYRHFCRRKKSI